MYLILISSWFNFFVTKKLLRFINAGGADEIKNKNGE